MLLVDYLCYAGVADVIAVAPDDLRISIALGVVGHSEGSREVELSLLEVVAEGGFQCQVSVGREGVAGIESHLVGEPSCLTVSDVEGVDDG